MNEENAEFGLFGFVTFLDRYKKGASMIRILIATVVFVMAFSLTFGQEKVFVTTETFDGNLGGLEGADSLCAAAASTAGLPGTWTAWLSDSSVDARDRIVDAEYRLLDGTIVATSLANLTDDSLDLSAAINLDENLATVPSEGFADDVWTGTEADGTWGGSGICASWTTNAPANFAQIGRANQVNEGWTDVGVGNSCASVNRLYCFSKNFAQYVFVTSETFDGNLGGPAGADSLCTAAATTVGLNGVWRAWLSDDLSDARDRIIDSAYQLLDGTLVATSLTGLTDGSLDTAINLDENLATVPSEGFADVVWTGTKADGTRSSLSNCLGWTSNDGGEIGQVGWANYVDESWTDIQGGNGCASPNRLYCFEYSYQVFSDGFESGDTGEWSDTVP